MLDGDVFEFVGKTIHGKYRIDEVIGEGGFGVVYRGYHLSFEQPIAVKCLKLPNHFTPDARELFLERFRHEGKHLAALAQHGSVTRVYDFAVAKGPALEAVPYLVLEWLEGRDLEAVLAERRDRGRPFTEREAVELLRPAVDAIAFAHQLGIAHRDIKPANLFVAETPRGEITKVLDFGIAKVMQEGDQATRATTRTSSGFRAFSPGYGAPEQFLSDKYGATGPWTDVHALALILTEMVAGQPAMRRDNAADLFATATGEHRPTPQSVGVPVSGGFEQLCAGALALMPEHRYRDAQVFLEAIDAWLEGELPDTSQLRADGRLPVTRPAGTRLETPLAVAETQLPTAPTLGSVAPPPAPGLAVTPAPQPWPPPPQVAPVAPVAPAHRRSGSSGCGLALGLGLLFGTVALGAVVALVIAVSTDEPTAGGANPAAGEEEAEEAPASAGLCKEGMTAVCTEECERDDQSSCVTLGWMYVTGNGVSQSYARALELFEEACEAGNPLGCNNVGWLHHQGWGVPKNHRIAVQYFRRACDSRDGRGCNNLAHAYKTGVGVNEDVREAMRIYEAACNRGNAHSCNNLGLIYNTDERVPLDTARAARLYRKACDGDVADACSNLGYLHEHGQGVTTDLTLAVTLYRSACDGDSARGCNNLGWAYQRGLGPLPQDLTQARHFYRVACDGGSDVGCTNLRKLGG